MIYNSNGAGSFRYRNEFANCQRQIVERVLSRRFAFRNKMQNTQCENEYLLTKKPHREHANT